MAKNIAELRQELGNVVEEQRKLLKKAEDEKRDLSADENTNYENMDKRVDALEVEIQREEKLQAREAELAKSKRDKAQDVADPENPEQRTDPRATKEYRNAFNAYLREGRNQLSAEEYRALQANIATAGGYLAPTEFVNRLIKFTDDNVFIRQMATKFTLDKAESMGAPSLDADPADADWTGELATGGEDSTMTFGKRELTPHPLAKRIKVSNKLLRVSVLDIDALVQSRLGYKFAVSQEKGFLTGSGANQPLGLFTASNDGIPTTRDVVTGSATDFTADGLIDAFYSLKEGYMRNATWLIHRDGIKRIRKLKGSDNNYLWQPGLSGGQPAAILERPYVMSEFVPNTFTTGLYVGMVADFSYYWIADALSMTVQRLVELYAETNQTGFIGRLETDGMPVLAEAFARIKTS